MAENASPKVAVFIDWQNAYKTAREAFDLRKVFEAVETPINYAHAQR